MFRKEIFLVESWNIILNFCTFCVEGCWGQPMLLFWKPQPLIVHITSMKLSTMICKYLSYHFNVRHPVVFSPQKENLCFGRWTNIFSIFSSFKQHDQTNFRRPKHFTRHTYIHTGTIFFINDLNSIFQRNISNMYLYDLYKMQYYIVVPWLYYWE